MKFSSLLGLVLVTLALNADAQTKKKAPKKWNIVVFVADDLAAKDIAPYGNTIVRTPNLTKLAGESLLFTNAFASSPTCAPSRSSLLTGLMPFRHGGHGNHAAVMPETKSIVHYLKPLNYKVAIAGKLHVGPEEVFPFERIANTNVPEPGFEKNQGLHYDLNMDPVDEWLRKQSSNQPFCLFVNDHSPHVIWPEQATYDPAAIDIPFKHIDTREIRASRARYYTDISKMDANLGKLLQSLEKRGFAENTLVVFTSDQGPQWPFAKWSLYEDGIRVPMMVRWPGKIAGGSTTPALVSLVDLLPTFTELAGGRGPEAIDGKSFLPLLQGNTTEHHKWVFATHTGDGQMNRSPSRMVRDGRYKYILNLAPEILYTTHMDRAKDHDGGREYWESWKAKSYHDPHAATVLWRYHNRPREEFYDLENDPNEWYNLASDSTFSERIQTMRTEMEAWRTRQSDTATGPEQLTPRPQPAGARKPLVPYIF